MKLGYCMEQLPFLLLATGQILNEWRRKTVEPLEITFAHELQRKQGTMLAEQVNLYP